MIWLARRASPTLAHDVASTAVVFRRAVAGLPRPRQRAAFVQRNLRRLSYEHVVAALWCSPAAARANVYQVDPAPQKGAGHQRSATMICSAFGGKLDTILAGDASPMTKAALSVMLATAIGVVGFGNKDLRWRE